VKRLLLGGGAGLVLMLTLAGCVVFQSEPTGAQQGVIGPVKITFTACASQSGGSPSGSCSNTGNSGDNASTDLSQLFVGFKVPAGTGGPDSFSSTSTGPSNSGPQLTFTQSASYTGELQRLDPAPSGMQWIGYVSQYVSYDNSTGEQNVTASPGFTLPTHSDGTPFAGPFSYRVVIGGRQYTGSSSTPNPDEPIDCGDSLTTSFFDSNADIVCVDDPSQATFDGSPDTASTRDAGVVHSPPVSVTAGETATMPFALGYDGAAASGASFTFSAGTSVPGTTPSPSSSGATPAGTGSTPVNVIVPVPAGTPAGTYNVTLTAQLPDGEIRSGTDVLVVNARPAATPTPPAPPTPPVVAPARKCLVPSVQGKTRTSATAAIKSAGCSIGLLIQRHSSVRRGRIIHQVPAAGTVLRLGGPIAVSESLGRLHHAAKHRSKPHTSRSVSSAPASPRG
jgi:hypothetical protein